MRRARMAKDPRWRSPSGSSAATDPKARCPSTASVRSPSWAVNSRSSPSATQEAHALGLRLGQAVPAAASPVDHVHLVRLLVAEDEEVVPDQLELEDRFLGVHRLHAELLRLDDLRANLLVDAHRTSRGSAV